MSKLLETWSNAVFWLGGLGLIVVSVLVITGSLKLAVGLAFGLLALLFLGKFEERQRA